MTLPVRDLLDALHLWLHRSGGDEALALACAHFDWRILPDLVLQPFEREALVELEKWHYGMAVDVIGAASDFHEACRDCADVEQRVARLEQREPDPERMTP